MALNSLICTDVLLRNCSLTHSQREWQRMKTAKPIGKHFNYLVFVTKAVDQSIHLETSLYWCICIINQISSWQAIWSSIDKYYVYTLINVIIGQYWFGRLLITHSVYYYVQICAEFNVQTLFETPSRLFYAIDFAVFFQQITKWDTVDQQLPVFCTTFDVDTYQWWWQSDHSNFQVFYWHTCSKYQQAHSSLCISSVCCLCNINLYNSFVQVLPEITNKCYRNWN